MYKLNRVLESNKAVYERVKNLSLCGMTENQLKAEILAVYKQELGEFTFEGDIVAGKNSAVGEGTGTDYVIQRGDAVILDLLPAKDGVCCDTTRTFFVGGVTKEQAKAYEIIKNALEETAKHIKAGVKAKTLYEIMRAKLAPYEDTFFHHAGHLIGAERLMQPQFLPDRNEEIKAGDIITLEPGLYFKDRFGIRLENNYLVTETGSENLFQHTLDIESYITKT